MNSKNYCSLHLHSCGSYLDSLSRPEDIAKRAKELEYPAYALTDHGSCTYHIKAYKEAKKNGIKIIPGMEAYWTNDHDAKERKSNHLTIICKNNEGLSNLYKLCTISNTPTEDGGGFYYKPRISWKDLEKYNQGLIVLSGCMNSIINRAFIDNNYNLGKEYAERFISILGKDRFFIELQLVNDKIGQENRTIYIPEQDIILEYSRKLAKDLGLRSAATNDCHYINKEDSFAHEILKAIDARATLADPPANRETGGRGRLVFNGTDYYLRSDKEMRQKFTDEEVDCTKYIADLCDVKIELKQNHIPKFDSNLNPKQSMEKLKEELRNGWKYFNINKKKNKDDYKKRIDIELIDIEDAGLQDYFLIVWDVVRYCINSGIPVGLGRGSAAGSLTSYLLQITAIDPVENGLIWERFWNRGRKGSMPDVDLDIGIERRDEVVKYLREKFGQDRVFPMCSISTMTAKAAIKDVGKVIGLPFSYTNELTNLIPHKCNSLKDAIKDVEEINKMAADGIDNDVIMWQKNIDELSLKKKSVNLEKFPDDIKDIDEQILLLNSDITERKRMLKTTFDVAQKIENISRQRSSHACAILIADEPIFGKVPLCFDAKKRTQLTAFDMYDLEEMGYLKLDILGLKTLDVCNKVYPEGIRGLKDFNDPRVFDLISSGNTKGVFQLESPLGRQWCKKLKPRNINELSDLNALLRPAVLEVGMADEYVKNRAVPENAPPIHNDLRPILGSTYGCVVYQEQMLEIARVFAGFSLSEADLLRKAVGKKIPEELAKLKDGFIKGVVKNYKDEKLGDELWSWIEKGAEYGFNRSHSLSYATMAYITAWMKLYHTEKFFLALLSYSEDEQDPKEEVRSIFFDAKRFGVHIKPPSIQRGNIDFELDIKDIYFGLSHIKGIGETSCNNIKKIKNSTWDDILYNKVAKINKGVLEALMLSGALDHLGMTRKTMLLQYEFINNLTDKEMQIWNHILNRIPDKLIKSIKEGDIEIVIKKANDFKEAIINLVEFLNIDNIKYKMINSNRVETLKLICSEIINKYDEKEFDIKQKAEYESHYLGIPATCSSVDSYYSHNVTHFLIEVDNEQNGIGICTVALISNIKKVIDKRGNEMAFIVLEDKSFCLDGVIFSKAYGEYKNILESGKVLILSGRKNNGSFIVNKVEAPFISM